LGEFASIGCEERTLGKYSMEATLVAEVVLTMFFLIVILGGDIAASAGRFCADFDRIHPGADPPDQRPGDKSHYESSAFEGASGFFSRLGARTIVVVLAGATVCGGTGCRDL